MTPDCNILNPLQRDGLSQRQRLIKALHPTYVLVDERDIADLLLYAKEYAKLLQYYSVENTAVGDWQRFLESDVTTVIATVAKFDIQAQLTAFQNSEANRDVVASLLPVIDLIEQVYQWYNKAVSGLQLHTALERNINSSIRLALNTVVAYQKRIRQLLDKPLGFQPAAFSISGIDINTIAPDTLLFSSGSYADGDDVEYALLKIKQLFQNTYEAVLSIIKQAPNFLEETLKHYPQHNAHVTLFLTFLQLYKIAQDDLNTFTQRHLDCYYQDVLQLHPKAERPDEVHLIFELAKNFGEHLLEKDTPLKAGKDALGAEVCFATDNNIVFNRTKLGEDGLKTVFVEKKNGIVQNIYAAPTANSELGEGEVFTKNEKWPTFGNVDMPYAEVGFAVASPMFFLQEGTRKIIIDFSCIISKNTIDYQNKGGTSNDTVDANANNANIIAYELRHNTKVYYSGVEDWVEALISEVKFSGVSSNQLQLTFEITLNSEQEAFSSYDMAILSGGLNTTFPVLKFILDNEGDSYRSLAKLNLLGKYRQINARTFNRGKIYTKNTITRLGRRLYINNSGSATKAQPYEDSETWQEVGKSYPYKYLTSLQIKNLDIIVDVQGMKNLILENDVGILNPAKPFFPFGPIPKVGSQFLIGSREIFQKSLTSLTLALTWVDLPSESFEVHYKEYTTAQPSDNRDFKVDISILSNGSFGNPISSNESLFKTGDSSPPEAQNPISITETETPNIFLNRSVDLEDFETFSNQLRRGFIRLSLKKDFLHKDYSSAITKYVKNSGSGDAPNEPYTPTISELKLSYTATETINFAETHFEKSIEQLFHIHPFGTVRFYPYASELDPKKAVYSNRLVPSFPTQGKSTDLAEGTLYIGLEDLEPEQNVSILFQVAEGSADPDLEQQTIYWSYLSQNVWVEFERTQILSDTTNGLLTSGIVTFVMPKAMNKNNTLLPAEKYWIKASVENSTLAVSEMILIAPQAVKASFRKTPANDLMRLASALPAETIAKLKTRRAATKKVRQAFSSFGGQLEEQKDTPADIIGNDRFLPRYNEFYIRVGERLKNKNRAITIDDYERLVLQAFPDIYKVKCLNHTRIYKQNNGQIASEHAPGFVKIIVLPNLRNQNAIDPLRPRVSSSRLSEIKEFLQQLCSDFVEVEVRNPIFERVSVNFKVKLHEGFDKGFYTQQLQQDIVKFLSPWLYDEGADLQVGGKIHRSVILNFVEEQAYVDYVTDFVMNHYVLENNGNEKPLRDVEEAIATSSSSVIISKEATAHIIDADELKPC